MEKITMNDKAVSETNYGVCSLLVLMASGFSGGIGFQLAFAQMASMFRYSLAQGAHGATLGNDYGFTGIALILVAFVALVWAIALAGAGFATNRGRACSLLTILVVLSPLLYILLQFFTGVLAAQPTSLFG